MKKSKVLLSLACAAMLVTASVAGTMAYLTSTDSVQNTFAVGQVEITLDEALVDGDGKALTGEKADRVQANSYKLMPGHEYDKDPTVTVKSGSEASYIKMEVTVSKIAELDEILENHEIEDLTDIVEGYNSADWISKGSVDDTSENTRTYTFYYKSTVAAPDADVALSALFTSISVPGEIENNEIATINDMTITVKAHAIQALGFTDAEDAWSEYKTS